MASSSQNLFPWDYKRHGCFLGPLWQQKEKRERWVVLSEWESQPLKGSQCTKLLSLGHFLPADFLFSSFWLTCEVSCVALYRVGLRSRCSRCIQVCALYHSLQLCKQVCVLRLFASRGYCYFKGTLGFLMIFSSLFVWVLVQECCPVMASLGQLRCRNSKGAST